MRALMSDETRPRHATGPHMMVDAVHGRVQIMLMIMIVPACGCLLSNSVLTDIASDVLFPDPAPARARSPAHAARGGLHARPVSLLAAARS